MYSFAQRSDTQVIDEPLYGHYLRVTDAVHPGADEVMADMDCDAQSVIQNTILGPCDRPVLFMKQMAHHLVDIDRNFLSQTTNVLLIRDPFDMLPSLVNQIEKPVILDTGLKMQAELLKELQTLGQNPPVLDSRELLKDPKHALTQLCDILDIPFENNMLSWQPGPRKEDGIWAKHWYRNVHKSTGFQPYHPKPEPFPTKLRPLLDECRPYYDLLYGQSIKA